MQTNKEWKEFRSMNSQIFYHLSAVAFLLLNEPPRLQENSDLFLEVGGAVRVGWSWSRRGKDLCTKLSGQQIYLAGPTDTYV
jgi:hypothetical protein